MQQNKISITLAKIYKWGSYMSVSVIFIGFIEMLFSKNGHLPNKNQITQYVINFDIADYHTTLFIGLMILVTTPLTGLIYLEISYILTRKYREASTIFLILTAFSLLFLKEIFQK